MNFKLFCLFVLTMPFLISGNFDLAQVKFKLDKSAQEINDFEDVIINCFNEFILDTDYNKCIDDNWNKTGIIDDKDPIGDCCFRMVFYVCTKQLLTAKCNVSKEVQEKDDVQFHLWNNIEIHENLISNCFDGN